MTDFLTDNKINVNENGFDFPVFSDHKLLQFFYFDPVSSFPFRKSSAGAFLFCRWNLSAFILVSYPCFTHINCLSNPFLELGRTNGGSSLGSREINNIQIRADDQGFFPLPTRHIFDNGIGRFSGARKFNLDPFDLNAVVGKARGVGPIKDNGNLVRFYSLICRKRVKKRFSAELNILTIEIAK